MILELEDVSKSYFQGENPVEVLSEINLQIGEKSSNLIIGPSGSGKSTLINLISLLTPPDRGEIRINGIYTSALSEKEIFLLRRREIGIIRQRDNLLPFLNLEENVRVPQIDRDQKKARELLQDMGIEQIDKCPRDLSILDQQKVALARALINNPLIVLADEPTGELDRDEAVKFLELIKDLSPDCPVLVASNNYGLKEYFDNVFYLEGGMLQKG